MVASVGAAGAHRRHRHVLIPFIAGQWSLPASAGDGAGRAAPVLIPFIAGQWSLPLRSAPASATGPGCLNPLHCGAVVASEGISGAGARPRARLNPLHCGAVVASRQRPGGGDGGGRVSIPFIAGQWSLPPTVSSASARHSSCLNPLHCGAVVASPSAAWRAWQALFGVSIPFIAGQWSLLIMPVGFAVRSGDVSIPFIAGQWSLPEAEKRARQEAAGLNPLHCGAVVASRLAGHRGHAPGGVSIPFIAGQWSLPPIGGWLWPLIT